MTDFLSRLADRILGDAPGAEPLIAPHFAQGAEIFGPDAIPFAVTQTDGYRYGDEQESDAISPGPLLDTSYMFVEETESPRLKREEAESGQQPPRKQQPAKARSTPTPHSDMEEGLTLSLLPSRPAENFPASMTERDRDSRLPTRAISPPVISLATEQQPSEMEARDLSAGIEPLQSEKEIQREIPQREVSKLIKQHVEARPADETRKDMPLSDRAQAPVRSTKESTRLEARSNEQQKSLAHRPETAARQIERASSGNPSDAQVTKQKTSNRYGANKAVKSAEVEKPLARPAASLSVEGVVPVPAVPVEYDSGGSKIVRPEKITPRGRADSPLRATISTARPNIHTTPNVQTAPNIQTAPNTQTAPTIKVTIGRIEVRAVLPPAPRAQEKALPAPRMSLDDYLKSVSGERR
jgi:hypothetical protein